MVRTLNDAGTAGTMSFTAGGRGMMVFVVVVLPVHDMKVGLWVPELLCETEIDDID